MTTHELAAQIVDGVRHSGPFTDTTTVNWVAMKLDELASGTQAELDAANKVLDDIHKAVEKVLQAADLVGHAVRGAAAEISRLKSGQLTPEELHNLCHNLPESDREAFRAGCVEYQKKLFGADWVADDRAELNRIKGVILDALASTHMPGDTDSMLVVDWTVEHLVARLQSLVTRERARLAGLVRQQIQHLTHVQTITPWHLEQILTTVEGRT
jgi:hypothetical protein